MSNLHCHMSYIQLKRKHTVPEDPATGAEGLGLSLGILFLWTVLLHSWELPTVSLKPVTRHITHNHSPWYYCIFRIFVTNCCLCKFILPVPVTIWYCRIHNVINIPLSLSSPTLSLYTVTWINTASQVHTVLYLYGSVFACSIIHCFL